MSWQAKADAVVTWRRLSHAGSGAVITLVAFWVGGYGWLIHGLTAAVAAGILWERATPLLARVFKWKHPHGNAWDVAWWALGSCVVIGIAEAVAR